MLIAVAAIAAFAAGMTGSWSPCGLSMISTLGHGGHGGGQGTTIAACGSFAAGALLGGMLTFATLAVVGAAIGGGQAALAAGACIAVATAMLELRGTPIVPQVRRQVPEHWRRVAPLPVAAAAYGVLLGLGFTTFVLTFAVPALAAVSLAIGDPITGVVMGLAFGAGRALPVVALAPIARHPLGMRAQELMMERPVVLRSFRFADGAALMALALALVIV